MVGEGKLSRASPAPASFLVLSKKTALIGLQLLGFHHEASPPSTRSSRAQKGEN